jgi:hypothetical protein
MSGGLRRAALRLHALAPADRDWIIGQLEPQHQARLRVVLAELEGLGIPAGDRSFESVLAAHEQQRSLEPDFVRQLLEAQPDRVKQVLRNEPETVVAVILAQRDWPWAEAVLKSRPARTRRRIRKCAAACQDVVAQRVSTALLKALAARLGEAASEAPGSKPRARWRSRVLALFRRPRRA